jgi:cation diffusion facilitator CzcD-associated flavoprotein CzcO
MPYYGYSDPAIWSTFVWTERYPSGFELRSYFQHVDSVWNLSKDISLHTRVVEARFRENGWDVTTDNGDTYRSKWLIAAAGTSAKPYVPTWDGMKDFKGPIHHSSLWPEEPVDMAGKRVAVIGAGATAIQVSINVAPRWLNNIHMAPCTNA